MTRPRSRAHQGLPDNLYRKLDKRTGRTYYTYRDPRNGSFHGLGTDHDAAINDARALNSAIHQTLRSARMTALILDKPASPTLLTLAMKHLSLCEKRQLADNTIRTRKSHVNAWLRLLGQEREIAGIGVKDFAEVIAGYEAKNQNRTALAMRTTAVEMWKDALAEGWAEANIPERTRAPVATVQRSRLSLEDFMAIYAVAGQVTDWLKNAMALALVTAQRREDDWSMEFRPSVGATAWVEGENLWVVQRKTGNRVCIPLAVSIAGFRLAEVVKSCRSNIISRWLIHHRRSATKAKPGDQVWLDTISRRFSDARDLAGIQGEPGKTPPTFHEIRSLAIRLYTEAYGSEFAQAIAGHKDAATTAIYRDVRGSEWIRPRVSAG